MRRPDMVAVLLACPLLLAVSSLSCASSGTSGTADTNVAALMERAEALEKEHSLAEAASAYSAIAELFPTSPYYPSAAFRTASLYADPENPVRNDSLAIRWFRIYQPLAPTAEEKQCVRIILGLLGERAQSATDLARTSATVDSLESLARRQAGSAAAQGKRVQELESQLRQVSQELKRLKEIDEKTARRRPG